jgi:EAL domain-containing protein (putative c-di-GMP-specific phosphodiesterase class I)
MEQRMKWFKTGYDLKVSVNIPVTLLLENGFVSRIAGMIKQHDNVNGIILEITENIFFSDYDRLSRIMNNLQDLGLSFSIDDFGTGHSSLSRLRQLPVSELKIDKSFVIEMLKNKDDEVIVRSTIELAQSLDIRICAEGVETAEVMNQLYHWRCDIVQGYHISKAMPVTDIAGFIEKSRWKIVDSQLISANHNSE